MPRNIAISVAVGMSKAKARARRLQDEVAAMDGAMVSAAKSDQVVGFVPTASGARQDVMDVEEVAVSAAGHATAVLVTEEDGAAESGRDRLAGARLCVVVRARVGMGAG